MKHDDGMKNRTHKHAHEGHSHHDEHLGEGGSHPGGHIGHAIAEMHKQHPHGGGQTSHSRPDAPQHHKPPSGHHGKPSVPEGTSGVRQYPHGMGAPGKAHDPAR